MVNILNATGTIAALIIIFEIIIVITVIAAIIQTKNNTEEIKNSIQNIESMIAEEIGDKNITPRANQYTNYKPFQKIQNDQNHEQDHE